EVKPANVLNDGLPFPIDCRFDAGTSCACLHHAEVGPQPVITAFRNVWHFEQKSCDRHTEMRLFPHLPCDTLLRGFPCLPAPTWKQPKAFACLPIKDFEQEEMLIKHHSSLVSGKPLPPKGGSLRQQVLLPH